MESPDNDTQKQHGFLCGVVEGFYGRPWTTEQRKDLFVKMKKWGMDSYLYAPKDDYKHRAYWRELYTVEEAEHLSSLISAAKESDIRFIYAISPGLDIIYSSNKDISALKRKLEQVNQLGCVAFAILFDDIDPDMSKADKEMFKSFAHAQVSVTNEAYNHINVDRFLFCPTQYCATRALPTVRTSEYLKTIGAKLDPNIDIMWTGGKVVTKDVTIESIEEVTEILKRPPVIWDNIHANDYDQKRVFLGPYAGRSPQLISRLRGVLTNPNCEYEANFIAIHTLAQWSKCCMDAKKKIAMNPDAKLETENEDGNSNHIPENLDPQVYHPAVALKRAIKEWSKEFGVQKTVWGPIVKPQIVSIPAPMLPSVNTCIDVTTGTTTTTTVSSCIVTTPSVPPVPTVNCTSQELTAIVENGHGDNTIMSSTSTTIMNSLASENKIVCADSVLSVTPGNCSDSSSLPLPESDMTDLLMKDKDETDNQIAPTESSDLEPMDCNNTTPPNSIPSDVTTGSDRQSTEDVLMIDSAERPAVDSVDTDITPPTTMQVEVPESDNEEKALLEPLSESSSTLSEDEISLLCDLFYLPFEHGCQGLQILLEFHWLKTNAHLVAGVTPKDKLRPEVMEWYKRAEKFHDLKSSVDTLTKKLNSICNRELLYELYPYVWDIRGVVSLMSTFVTWLSLGKIPVSVTSYVHGSYTWFSKGWREAFTSGDQEPWVIRGGLTAELQRLIPVDRGTDLFIYKAPEIPSSQVYEIRPFQKSDTESVYKVCVSIFKDGVSNADDMMGVNQLPCDLWGGRNNGFLRPILFAGDLGAVHLYSCNLQEWLRKIGIRLLDIRVPDCGWIEGFLHLDAEVSFVVEDESQNIVGVAVAAFHAKDFRAKLNTTWKKVLKDKYSTSIQKDPTLPLDLKEIPEDVVTTYPAELKFIVLNHLLDPSVPKRLMTCVLAALRANGVFGCFIEVKPDDKLVSDFYKKLGFKELHPTFLGRTF